MRIASLEKKKVLVANKATLFIEPSAEITIKKTLREFNKKLSLKLFELHFRSDNHVERREAKHADQLSEPTLQEVYLHGLGQGEGLVNDFIKGIISNEDYATYLYQMSVAAFRLQKIDEAVIQARHAYNLAESPKLRFEVLYEYILVISCIRVGSYTPHLQFLRPALRRLFSEIQEASGFAVTFASLYGHSTGEVALMLEELYEQEENRRDDKNLREKVQIELENGGYVRRL